MSNRNQHPHKPVLLEETVSALVTDKDGIYIGKTDKYPGYEFHVNYATKNELFEIEMWMITCLFI